MADSVTVSPLLPRAFLLSFGPVPQPVSETLVDFISEIQDVFQKDVLEILENVVRPSTEFGVPGPPCGHDASWEVFVAERVRQPMVATLP